MAAMFVVSTTATVTAMSMTTATPTSMTTTTATAAAFAAATVAANAQERSCLGRVTAGKPAANVSCYCCVGEKGWEGKGVGRGRT